MDKASSSEKNKIYRKRYYRKHQEEIKRKCRERYHGDSVFRAAKKARDSAAVKGAMHRRGPYLLKKYGITEDGYNELLGSQGWVCAICGRVPLRGSDFVVDHCHKTGRIRGILCRQCNQGLGMMGDSPGNLMRAFNYLNERGFYGK